MVEPGQLPAQQAVQGPYPTATVVRIRRSRCDAGETQQNIRDFVQHWKTPSQDRANPRDDLGGFES